LKFELGNPNFVNFLHFIIFCLQVLRKSLWSNPYIERLLNCGVHVLVSNGRFGARNKNNKVDIFFCIAYDNDVFKIYS